LLSNDTQPNKLYRKQWKWNIHGEGASLRVVAFSEDGVARAGMGVDTADYDRSGNTSLMITNFRTR